MQCAQLLLKIGRYFIDMLEDVFLLHDIPTGQSGRAGVPLILLAS